jgi:hypothetical protein
MTENKTTAPEKLAAKAAEGVSAPIGLSSREELLLVAFYDQECGFVDSLRARMLLTRSSVAREFYAAIERTEIAYKAYAARVSNESRVDLWDRISARIDAEMRAEVFLGGRSYREPSVATRITGAIESWRSRLAWGASGAALASFLGMGLIYGGYLGTGPNGGFSGGEITRSASGRIPLAAPVSYQGRSQSLGVRESVRTSPVEMDWMRSEGRLRLLQDPDQRTAIIWVKPRSTEARVAVPAGYGPRLSRRSTRSNSQIPVAVPAAGR